MILLDTNILLRFANPNDPAHHLATAVIQYLLRSGKVLCIVPQNLYEFWVAATRPLANNGLGLSIAECEAKVNEYIATFQLLPDTKDIFNEWFNLVRVPGCLGKVAHDARFVAAMRTHGIGALLTFNTGDFARYAGLTILDPNLIAATLPPIATP